MSPVAWSTYLWEEGAGIANNSITRITGAEDATIISGTTIANMCDQFPINPTTHTSPTDRSRADAALASAVSTGTINACLKS